MSLLTHISSPEALRKLPLAQLPLLCTELRAFVLEHTTTKEGHIKSSLGVTELSVALHYAYRTPLDILVWDVGHQAYIHKILTGRKDLFATNRQFGGLSGFTSRAESPYDPFGAGHSSTALSALTGFAEAARLSNTTRQHIAVVGDGAFTGGMHFEAMNYAGERQLDVTLLINNNRTSIDENVGALQKLQSYKTLCQAFGFQFMGEADGHDPAALIRQFKLLKKEKGPRALLIHTQKGKGYPTPTILKEKKKETAETFQEIAGSKLMALAKQYEKLMVISPAMLSGAGLHAFRQRFPERCFDVGIAEQQAVTMAAALAADGFRPVCHLYSTFAQRAYDQIIHDVALQKLPVTFLLDRAGLVGEDGATHHGVFDLSFLNPIPNLTISAPADGHSLNHLLEEALQHTTGPFAIRYPKGESPALAPEESFTKGKGRWVKRGAKKLVISIGAVRPEVLAVIKQGTFAHYDWIYLKPFNKALALEIIHDFAHIITLEEGSSAGGLGQAFAHLLASEGIHKKLSTLSLPDVFVPHGDQEALAKSVGFDATSFKKLLEEL